MKYYILKYTDKIANGFGGTTQGPVIKIRPTYKGDLGLLEHEKTHVKQWLGCFSSGLLLSTLLALVVSPSLWGLCGLAPLTHPLLYKFIRPYRRWSEVQAYRKQMSLGGYTSNGFAVMALVEKYDLGLSVEEALLLLRD